MQRSGAHLNFYNYAHSILVLMLWILPINMPTLVVWIHNLAVQWLTPFSSHHNVLSIMPLILLVETLTSGKMIPRVTTRWVAPHDTSLQDALLISIQDTIHNYIPLHTPCRVRRYLRRHLRIPLTSPRQHRCCLARNPSSFHQHHLAFGP